MLWICFVFFDKIEASFSINVLAVQRLFSRVYRYLQSIKAE